MSCAAAAAAVPSSAGRHSHRAHFVEGGGLGFPVQNDGDGGRELRVQRVEIDEPVAFLGIQKSYHVFLVFDGESGHWTGRSWPLQIQDTLCILVDSERKRVGS